QLGLPGKPSIAEELMVARDNELVKYTGSKIHFTGVSTTKSIELISKAKKEGLQVSCSAVPYHFLYTHEDMTGYDTNLKLNPPLRTKQDRQALIDAVLDGTIDCIASHHLPQNVDNKLVEFEYAKNGMIGLQTSFAMIRTAIPGISVERLVGLFSTAAGKIFELNLPSLTTGQRACISLFLPNQSWSFTKELSKSKSSNTSLFGKELYGRPLGIINKGGLFLND
ncbi:MAG: dihydroorotase family protein, partial [Chitinophagaceae bacterium]